MVSFNNFFDTLYYSVTYESHAAQDGDAVNALDGQIDETGDHDDQVEDIPTAAEVLLTQGQQL